jgi:hypothetical protein
MDEQLLKDFLATAQADNYNWDVIMPKFPELADINLQVLKDYAETAIQKNYDYETINPLFPELFSAQDVKKKDDTVLPSEDGLSVQFATSQLEGDPFVPQINKPAVSTSTTDSTLQIEKEEDPEAFVSIEDISKDEEYIVPELNYKFNNEGFVFKQAGFGTDNVEVKALNNETITIGLDAFTTKGNKKERDRLNKFIESNREESIMLQKAQGKYDANKIIFKTEKEVQESLNSLNEEANLFAEGVNNYLKNKTVLEEERKALDGLTTEQRKQEINRIKAFNTEQQKLNASFKKIQKFAQTQETRQRQLDLAVGEYYEMKRNQGSMTAGMVDMFLRGMGQIPAGIVDFAIDSPGSPLLPKRKMTPEEEQASDLRKKELKEKMLPPIREFFVEKLGGGKDVSDQWKQSKQEKFWSGAFLGLAQSMPAFLSPSKFLRIPALIAQTDSMYQEEFKDIDLTEDEKAILKIPLALTVGVLENVGFRNVINQSGLVKSLLFGALKKVPTKATPSVLRDVIRNEVKSKLARAGLTYSGAALAEAETGFLQQGADILGKSIYNYLEEKEIFQTPESIADGFSEMIYAAGQEAVGGFVLGTLPAISDAYAKKDFTRVDKDVFDMFLKIRNDGVTKKAFIQQLKLQQEKGEITKQEAEVQLANFEKAAGLINQIPSDLSPEKQQQVLGLLASKQELINKKADKDPTLVGNIDAQIAAIDKDIKNIVEEKVASQERIKEEGQVEEKAPSLKTKVEKEQAEDIESFFGDEVEETTETITDNLSINRSKKKVTKPTKVLNTENKLIKIAQRGAKAVSKILPKTRMILHETTEEFEKFASPGRGEYNPTNDVIHINLEKASVTTVPHEIFHAVFLNKVKTDPAAAQLAETMMISVRKALPATSPLAKRIDTFAESYTDVTELQNEERLAELIGILSSEYKTLTKPNKNKVVKFIEGLARQLGVDIKISEFTKTDEDVIDLLNTLSGKVATGEELVEGDIKILEQGELIPQAEGIIPDNIKGSGRTINFPRQQLDPPFQLDNGGIDFNNIRRGNINELEGVNAFVFAADQATFGKIKSPTGLEFNFYGGYLYPYGTKYGWAFTDKVNAQKVLNKVKESDGVGLVLSQAPDGIKGSFNFFEYLNAEIAHAINKGASPKELLDYVNQKLRLTSVAKSLKKRGFPTQINDLEQLKYLFPFEGNNKVSYLIRGNFAASFFSATSSEKFGIPPLRPTANIDVGVLDYVNAPSLKNVGNGDIISAIQFDKNSKIMEVREGQPDYHPSYPYTISGNPIMVFNEAVDVRKVYPDAAPAGLEKTAARPKGVNKTPLKKRLKKDAAKSAAFGQYVAKIPKNIDTSTEPKIIKRQQRTIEQVAQLYNMDNDGFIPKTANLSQLRRAVEPFGLGAKRSRPGERSGGESLYMTRNGKKFNPFKQKLTTRQQRATEEYISEGRDAGFKDTVIIDYLSRVQKVPMKEIKEAMEIVSENLGALPPSFKNIQGGAKAGLKLFKRINKLVTREKNKKKPLAESQILEKAIAYMQRQPEYKNEADTYKVSGETRARRGLSTQQMLMELDLQKILGIRPTQDMSRKLGIARVAVKQRIKGIKDVQKIKTELKNFMRKTLPARVLARKDAQKMFRYIERVTPDFMQSTQAQGAKMDNLFQEVTDFVAEENNKILTKEIQSILEGKYEKTERAKKIGKTIDSQTRKRIEGIRKMVSFSGLTSEQINELQAKLTEEFNILLKETNPTDEQLNRMGDLQIAINYANAEVMENTNPRKTQVLDSVYAGLTSIIEIGKQQLKKELEASAKRYRAEMAAVYEEITGKKLDPDDPNFKNKLAQLKKVKKSEEERKKLDGKLKKFFRGLKSVLRLPTAESLSGLMDRISSLPGEMMGGAAQELVTDKINASSIQYKRRMLVFNDLLQNTLKEYYGKNWAKKARKFKKDIIIVEDSEGVKHYYTQDQMAYLYNQYKNIQTHPAFKNMYGNGYADTMKKIEALLNPELKAFADWQVNEYFPAVYNYYNSIYKKIYRTDMPQTQNYAGRIFRTEGEPEAVSLLADRTTFNTSVTSPSLLLRSYPATEILAMNLTDALVSYTRDMEYFAAYAEAIRDVNKIFTNPFIEEAIRRIHGNTTFDSIKNMFEKIAAKGPQRAKGDSLLNKLNSYFITARIGLSPVIAIKQLTSMFTYANDIGITNWIKYSMKNLPQVIKTWKEIRDNSVYMQDRKNDSILRQIETYANLDRPDKVQWLPSKSTIFYENFIMFYTKFGDRTAIMLGGMPNYLYYKDLYKNKNPGASEQQVIDYAVKRFEKDTKETQQSSDLQDKDYFQTSNPWVRAMNMFMTTPKQYLRKEITASRNLMRKLKAWDRKAGKGTITENVRQLLIYHFFMPMLFQWVSAGFPISDWEDEDSEDMLRAAIIGNFNALFIAGEIIAKTGDAIQQKPWYKDFRQLAIYEQAGKMLGSLQKFIFGKTEKERGDAGYQLALDVLTTRGVPTATLEKFAYNYPKLTESEDFGEFMLRLLNYSKYQIEGRPKKGGVKKRKMTKSEIKKFYPDLYEAMQEMEDPELKQLEKDIREMEKEMLELMYE